MMADINQGAIPALLPFLKESMGLSYTMAGVILLVSNFASSITQPLFGVIADKRSQGWLIPVGIFLASISFSLTGIAPGYITLLILVFFSGMGVAAFHPEGFRMAHYFTGKKQATGMSIFSVGGNFGTQMKNLGIDCLIIEGKSQKSIFALDNSGHVITLGTFSKIFVPGFRIGWVIANAAIVDKFVVAKQNTDLCTSPFVQKIAAKYIEKGLFDDKLFHLYKSIVVKLTRKEYKKYKRGDIV